jgi:putative NIF3 family GTP cyclohydrolase 1 type 2
MAVQLVTQDVMDRIRMKFGPAWKSSDVLASGASDAPVTGIVVSYSPTLEVLEQAVKSGRNMIVSLEPPYWSRPSPSGGPAKEEERNADPTYVHKMDFIERNQIKVFRVRDSWTSREEDGQLLGLAKALGWEKFHKSKPGLAAWTADNNVFTLPSQTFGVLAADMKKRLKARAVRCIGEPSFRVSNAVLTHGYITVKDLEKALTNAADVVVCGEPCEWEAGPYFMDLIASGQKKGMVILGNEVSSEPGCGELAAWLSSFITEVPVEWIPAGEPFIKPV